ncbi:MAG TPA: hypothetical protein VNN80_23715 [Polyangiaceae bacterium]|nr:hypothetical protein [Polyangiaceae bacterium]
MSAEHTPTWNVRKWLLQNPKPARVRIVRDGEPQEMAVGNQSWMALSRTIVALAPDLIEALTEAGELIRATRPEQELQRSEAAEIPEGLQHDPNALLITHFANLIHRAYESSCEVAFQKLVDITERMNERSESIERRLERAESANRALQQERYEELIERAQEFAENAAGGGDPQQAMFGQMMQGFLGGAMQGRPPRPPSNGANGKGTA